MAGFAGLLQLLQAALVLGIFGSASVYITGSTADLWVGYPGTQRQSLGDRIDARKCACAWMPTYCASSRFAGSTPIGAVREIPGGVGVCQQIDAGPDGLMFARPADGTRARLAEPGAVIVDRADLSTSAEPVMPRPSTGNVCAWWASPAACAPGGVNVLAPLATA